jgi:four helix bundle protein
MAERALRHTDLEVYKRAFALARRIFELSKAFPKEETYSLTDQIRRSSRSVCTNIAEAWRKRIYEAAFVAKINDADAEAAETQVWIAFALDCEYIAVQTCSDLSREYDEVLAMLVSMRHRPGDWIIRQPSR